MPAGQRYIPGTNILETTWGTKTGWLIVRDVLLVGPWRHDRERSHTHRRSPTDYDAEHVLLRTLRCVNGTVQVQMECDPIYDYGRAPATWEYSGEGYEECTATFAGHDLKLTLHSDLRLGIEGSTVRARTTMHDGDSAFVALSWSDHQGRRTWEDAYGAARAHRRLLARVARPGRVPRPSLAPPPAAQRADAQGARLRADGRDAAPPRRRRCPRRPAASATGTTATRGCATRRSCSGRCTRSASTGRPTTSSTSSPRSARTPTCRSCTASAASASSPRRSSATSRATSTRSPCASATPPTATSSTTSGAARWTPSTCTRSRATGCARRTGRCSARRSRRR